MTADRDQQTTIVIHVYVNVFFLYGEEGNLKYSPSVWLMTVFVVYVQRSTDET